MQLWCLQCWLVLTQAMHVRSWWSTSWKQLCQRRTRKLHCLLPGLLEHHEITNFVFSVQSGKNIQYRISNNQSLDSRTLGISFSFWSTLKDLDVFWSNLSTFECPWTLPYFVWHLFFFALRLLEVLKAFICDTTMFVWRKFATARAWTCDLEPFVLRECWRSSLSWLCTMNIHHAILYIYIHINYI